MRLLFATLILFSPATLLAQHTHPTETKSTTLTSGYGRISHPVTTKSPDAQKFFNQGLACIYGFNHEEAVRSFKRAAELDPGMGMAYWGIALALGSNYNLQAEGPQLLEAYANLQKAVVLAPKVSENDRAYIEALAKRYSDDLNADRSKLANDYKNAMGELMKRYPDDLDAATLYAESMMNLRPWKLWSLDGKPAEGTLEIISVLESVLRRDPNHTGANHYYIHAVEASQNPERALPSAGRLGTLAPDSGHLVHMPSHIYIRTGDYTGAAKANADAIVADRKYITSNGAAGVYPMMYYNHNIHFLASANSMKGRYQDAIKAARELQASVAPHLKTMPMLENFALYPIVTQVRFHRWKDILEMPKPDSQMKVMTAYWRFGRGMAYAGTAQAEQAQAELDAFREVAKSVPPQTPFGNNVVPDVLRVAENLLAAKLAFVKNDRKSAFELFASAVAAEDAIAYDEPADWDLPTRETFGASLLVAGNFVQAEQVFRAELKKHKRNGRALFGLAESLKGQKKSKEAQAVLKDFRKEWATADIKLTVRELAGLKS